VKGADMSPKPINRIKGNQATDTAEMVALGTRQILLALLDLGSLVLDGHDPHRIHRNALETYWEWRQVDRRKFLQNIQRLRRKGIIRSYYQDKELVFALTKEGKQRAQRAQFSDVILVKPTIWNRKWHLIIFDIPERQRLARDVFRVKLRDLGFAKLQKSVFVHPFDATDLVDGIRKSFDLHEEIQYVVADQIEQEEMLIEHFLKKGVLTKAMFLGK
jgi:CRISPR-associated endonuclease Cas2